MQEWHGNDTGMTHSNEIMWLNQQANCIRNRNEKLCTNQRAQTWHRFQEITFELKNDRSTAIHRLWFIGYNSRSVIRSASYLISFAHCKLCRVAMNSRASIRFSIRFKMIRDHSRWAHSRATIKCTRCDSRSCSNNDRQTVAIQMYQLHSLKFTCYLL